MTPEFGNSRVFLLLPFPRKKRDINGRKVQVQLMAWHPKTMITQKYSCLRICSVDDAKVIVIDLICTCSKLIFQPKSNKHRTKTGNKKHTAQRREIKTNKVVQRRQNHKNKRKKTENM
ncbi:cysteine protease, putative [Medicago truncatula]|uniref:Cysteine protease, putative n=1 Tax=Medicago truncatula TaxID=3880 RepID=G7IMP4_MEDTR|nr:cysteine protease, putative [Medicago truncatula]